MEQGHNMQAPPLEPNMSFEMEMKNYMQPAAGGPQVEQPSLLWQQEALQLLNSNPPAGPGGAPSSTNNPIKGLNDLGSLTMSKLVDNIPSRLFENDSLWPNLTLGLNGTSTLLHSTPLPQQAEHAPPPVLNQGPNQSRATDGHISAYDDLVVDNLITTLSKATVDDSPPQRIAADVHADDALLQQPDAYTAQPGLPFIPNNGHVQPPGFSMPPTTSPLATGMAAPVGANAALLQMLRMQPGNMAMPGALPLDTGALMNMLNLATPGAPPATASPAGSGPSSAATLQDNTRQMQQQLAFSGLKRKLRSNRAELTFEEYENKYGVSSKCESGPCADHCSTPCKTHTCRCCKKNRRMEVATGGNRVKGYCGYCMRREKVEGLLFVKCCHVTVVDGQSVRCGVEMLKEVFDNHWKQHKNDGNPKFEVVDTDEGRSCRACTNMRPVTFYPSQDTNCSCNHCQMVKSKGGRGTGPGRDAPERPRRLSTPVPGTGAGMFGGFIPDMGNMSPRAVSPVTARLNDESGAGHNPFARDGSGAGQQAAAGMGTLAPHFGDAPGSAGNVFGAMPSLPVTPFSVNPLQTTEQLVQQARGMLDTAYVNVTSAVPSIGLLVSKLQAATAAQQQPAADARATLQPLVDACRTIVLEAQQLIAKCEQLND